MNVFSSNQCSTASATGRRTVKKGTIKSGFDKLLTLSKHDVFYELKDFLSDAVYVALQIPIKKMVKGGKTVVCRPDDVVIKDAPSTLFSVDGKKLKR